MRVQAEILAYAQANDENKRLHSDSRLEAKPAIDSHHPLASDMCGSCSLTGT